MYTAAQLAGLPGLPTSRQAIARKAERENWAWVRNPNQGGGKLYPLQALPPITQAHLTQSLTAESRGGTLLSRIRVTDRDRYQAKTQILLQFQTWQQTARIGVTKARELFTKLYNTQQILPEPRLRIVCPKLSARTLHRWGKIITIQSTDLRGRYGNRKGKNKIDSHPQYPQYIKAYLAEGFSCAEIRRQLKQQFPHDQIPSRISIWRWVTNYQKTNPAEFTLLTDPQKYNDKYRPAVGSNAAHITRKNQEWAIDATKLDIIAADGKRYILILLIDLYSRRLVGHLCQSSSTEEVTKLLSKAITIFGGIPQHLVVDNGKEFVSLAMQQSLIELGIKIKYTDPYSPWQKGHIERAFGTLNQKHWSLLAGYCGSNVAHRQRITKRDKGIDKPYTLPQLKKIVDAEIDRYNHQHHHQELNTTPQDKWNNCPAPLCVVTPAALYHALAPWTGARTITKGIIKIRGHKYSSLHGDQCQWEGRKVNVKHDPQDMGTILCYNPENHEFLFELTCPELVGEKRSDHKQALKIAEKERRAQVRYFKQQKANNRKQRRDDYDTNVLKVTPANNIIPFTPETPKPQRNLSRTATQSTSGFPATVADLYRRKYIDPHHYCSPDSEALLKNWAKINQIGFKIMCDKICQTLGLDPELPLWD